MKIRPGAPRLFEKWLAAALVMTVLCGASAQGWQGAAVAPQTAPATATLTPAEQATAARLKTETIRDVTTTLASKEMEGRGTATPGGERAARYLAERFAKFGLKPRGDNGTYLQAVRFRTSQVLAESSVKVGETALKFGDDFVVSPPFAAEQVDASGTLVFAGYGVTSETLKRDDLAGMDVKGKIVVYLNARPKNIPAAEWRAAVGRQGAFLNLARRGAAAIIAVIPRDSDNSYARSADYLTRRRVELASAPSITSNLPPTLIANESAAEKIFAGTGDTYAQTLERAANGEPVTRELNKQATLNLRISRKEEVGHNVVAVLEGSDPKLKEEAVVYTAHYDAYGMSSAGRIYPGAADNALGVGEIVAIAEAFAKSKVRPRRSLIFLPVTGEEYGLLGAEHWAQHPTWSLARVVANINYDGIGTEVYGPVKNVVGFGMEHSTLGPVLESVVAATGTKIAPDPLPEERVFYRSDHFELVKQGVPALMLLGGPEMEREAFIARMRKWLETDYHQPGDVVRPDWHWDGARTIALIGLLTGMRVANADAMPTWLPSSPFYKPRATAAPAQP